jgi:hypothetical protein
VSKQTATALVDRLESAGYVERVVDPTDARARLVRTAPRGESLIPIARQEEARIEAERTARLGRRRMSHLREALELLREITDPYKKKPNTETRTPNRLEPDSHRPTAASRDNSVERPRLATIADATVDSKSLHQASAVRGRLCSPCPTLAPN